MHYFGVGVLENYREAAKWYRKAAEQGLAHAQYNLSVMYIRGEGVSENYVKAYAWANLASAQEEEGAVERKTKLRKRMSSGQVVKAQKLAGKLFKRIESSKARKRKFYRQMLNTRYMDAVLSAVRQSKTNQEGDTADVRFLKNGAAAAIRTLRTDRPAAAPTDRVKPHHRRFTAAARAAGIEAHLTAHSGRVGLASELTARGASTTEVMLAGNWKTARMVSHYSAGATARTRGSRQVSVKTRVSNFLRAGNGGERHTSIPHQNHVTQELTPRAHEKITAAFDSIAPRPKPGH